MIAFREIVERFAELEAAELFGQRLFQVWINEDAPPASGDDGWDACMKQVDDADVVLVLYNGNAGWTGLSPLSVGTGAPPCSRRKIRARISRVDRARGLSVR